SSSAGFPSRARLGSVARRKSERSQDIALRVYAADEPGYLRGKAYHWLTTVNSHYGPVTQWEEAPASSADPTTVGLAEETLEPSGTEAGRFRFDLREVPGRPFRPQASMEIWLEAPQWGVYFLPPLAADLLTNEAAVRRDYRQVTSGTEAGAVTYVARTGPPPDRVPSPDAAPAADAAAAANLSRESLTFVPGNPLTAGSDPAVRAIADEIFRDCRTVEDHIRAVESHFRSNYGYAIGIDPPAGQDPLRWFLVARPKAHCEYFAQAAAFLLRTRGIPTRYMTGFVAAERNEYGDYWLARNEHAHAWCEAWDDRLGWVVVEATPPAGVPSESAAPRHRQLWEYLSGRLAQFRYGFGEGGWAWLFRQVLGFLATPAGWAVVTLIAGYVTVRLWMRRSSRPRAAMSPAIAELNRLLCRMDRRVAKVGLVRKPGETLARFAARVESEAGDAAAAAWYVDYAETRYSGAPKPEAVLSLRRRLNALGPPPPRRVREAVGSGTG
ncbi:MAG TPA: transglutaminase-like domain-containing protein, partial [Planctomycetaceae bacterium]